MSYNLINFHPTPEKVIKHIGFIPDGSGRWSVKKGIELTNAYLIAVQKMAKIVHFCFEQKCDAVSLYLSSVQNFRRPQKSIISFCDSQATFCNDLLPPIANLFNTQVKIAGNLEILPESFRQSLENIEKLTENNISTRLYLCVAYNPLEEIVQAISKTPKDGTFLDYLWVTEPLDLVIRTGDANVLSNFLPLQAGYARFYTLSNLFPDVELNDYAKIMSEFISLERHFGD